MGIIVVRQVRKPKVRKKKRYKKDKAVLRQSKIRTI